MLRRIALAAMMLSALSLSRPAAAGIDILPNGPITTNEWLSLCNETKKEAEFLATTVCRAYFRGVFEGIEQTQIITVPARRLYCVKEDIAVSPVVFIAAINEMRDKGELDGYKELRWNVLRLLMILHPCS